MAATKAGKDALSGPDKAAVIMLALGEEQGTLLWEMMQEDEIREISLAMANLGNVKSELVEQLFMEFVNRLSTTGGLMRGRCDAGRCAPAAPPGGSNLAPPLRREPTRDRGDSGHPGGRCFVRAHEGADALGASFVVAGAGGGA